MAAGVMQFIGMFALTGVTSILSAQVGSSQKDHRWWDIFHRYYYFGPEYTDAIDAVLMQESRARLGNRNVIAPGQYTPAIGKHVFLSSRFSDKSWDYWDLDKSHNVVYLEKRQDPISEQIVYTAWISPLPRGAFAIREFEQLVQTTAPNQIRVHSIDTSNTEPQLLMLDKIYHDPRPHQQQIVELIQREYNVHTNFNVKVLLTGPRGSGKTFVGRLVARALTENGFAPRLYDDFDPNSVAVNINRLALKYASAATPVIIVINEIDRIYHSVINDSPDYDPRLKHARNKNSFNNMLDVIGDTLHVIAIYTAETSYEDIYAVQDYQSFVRRGRVDWHVAMTEATSAIHSI